MKLRIFTVNFRHAVNESILKHLARPGPHLLPSAVRVVEPDLFHAPHQCQQQFLTVARCPLIMDRSIHVELASWRLLANPFQTHV